MDKKKRIIRKIQRALLWAIEIIFIILYIVHSIEFLDMTNPLYVSWNCLDYATLDLVIVLLLGLGLILTCDDE